MTGDAADMLTRLKMVLPTRWFADATPVLDGLLSGLAATAAWLYGQLDQVRQQTRLGTASGMMLDMACVDFFGARVARRAGQSDASLRAIILRELLRARATPGALAGVLGDLTGRMPDIFEPLRPSNVGGYGGALGYGVAGRWASLNTPFQCLVTAYRPTDPALMPLADADIEAAMAGVMPVASIAWTQISS